MVSFESRFIGLFAVLAIMTWSPAVRWEAVAAGSSDQAAARVPEPPQKSVFKNPERIGFAGEFRVSCEAPGKLPTLLIVGDSTVNNSVGTMRGWGQELGAFFDPAKVHVVNRAIGGRSSRTYRSEGRWARVLTELRPGDVVLIQFGHNDAGRYDDPKAKGRPSLHGEGDETAEVKKSDGSTETVHTFGWYMRQYCIEARSKGATVILCSMVPHKDWTPDGKVSRRERGTFVKWTRDAARKTGAQFIDLNEIVAGRYERLGREKVENFFADPRTHTTAAGAKFTAEAVIGGLKSLNPDPLAGDFSSAGRSIAPATQPGAAPEEKR